ARDGTGSRDRPVMLNNRQIQKEPTNLKITKIRTMRLYDQSSAPFQDSTMARAANGLAWMFIELETNAGITGIAYAEAAGPVRPLIHEQLSDLVVGADPFETEKIWNDMFWRVRGNGRKG